MYVSRRSLGYLEFGNTHQLNYFDIGTVATTPAWNTISSTYLRTAGYVKNAYLDAYFPVVQNTNVAANRLSALHNIQVSRSDVVGWNNAIPMAAQTMYLAGSQTINYGRQVGNIDIAAVVNACIANSTAMQIQWPNVVSDLDSIRISNSYFILRCTRG